MLSAVRSGLWARLTASEQRLLPAILSHCDRYGVCFPGTLTLAREAGLDRRTVRRTLRGLEGQGIVLSQYRGPGRGLTNIYALVAPDDILHSDIPRNGACGPPLPVIEMGPVGPPKGTYDYKPISSKPSLRKKGNKEKKGAAATPLRAASPSPQSPLGGFRRYADRENRRCGNRVSPGLKSDISTPGGFPAWLAALNAASGLQPPKSYVATSKTGRALTAQYRRAVEDGRWTADDLIAAIPVAMAKAARGFEAAARPTWVLANLEELLLGPAAVEHARLTAGSGNGGGRRTAPCFRTGEDLRQWEEDMNSVVEWH